MKHHASSTPLTQQDTRALIMLSLLVIIVQPALHVILRLLPNVPPDPLALSLLSVVVSAVVLLAVVLVPPLRRYSPWLHILNAVIALIVVHQLVVASGNQPMYLAASLTAVYSASLTFARLKAWVWTMSLVCVYYLGASIVYGTFATPQGRVTPLFYGANYIIATVLVFGRDWLMARTLPTRRAPASHSTPGYVSDPLTSDLVLAREIQASLLPAPAPAWPQVDLVCYSQPARDVGGDFYSYYTWSNVHVAVALGDVSGKGVSAALLMAASLSLVNASFNRKGQPQRRVARLDRQMMAYTKPREQNCALCYVELDGPLLTVINAGGIAPYVRRADGMVEATDAWGFALGQGLGAQVGYQPVQRYLARGDIVVIVSDGVLEARNTRGELFSFTRLEQAIAAGPGTSAEAMRHHLLKRLKKFTGQVEPHDDVTIVVLRVR